MTRKVRIVPEQILLSVFLIGTIFVNEDVLVFGTINNGVLINFKNTFQVAITLIMLFYCVVKKVYIPKSLAIIGIFFACNIFFTMILTRDIRPGYFFMVMIYLDCVLLLCIFSAEKIYEFVYKSVYLIALFSLIAYVVQIFVPSLLSMLPTIENTAGIDFYFAGLTNLAYRTDNLVRNWGPFREPGVFQAFIMVALYYGMLIEKKAKLMHNLVLIVALLTTFSTTGYIALIFLLLASLVSKNNEDLEQRRMVKTIIAITSCMVLYLGMFTDLLYREGYGSVFGKLFGTYESLSMNSRIAGIEVNLRMMLESPLWGNGISYVDNNYALYCQSMYSMRIVDNTNMLFIQGARFGGLMFIYTFARYFNGLKNIFCTTGIASFLLFLSYVCLLISENFSYSVIISLPMFCIKSGIKKGVE